MAQWVTTNKTFLITGGASGLGAGYAETFLNQGAKNVAILDIAEELGKATAERLNKVHGNKAVFIKCDISKEDDITNAFETVLAQFKQIDVIINNAGIMIDAPNMWRIACDVNWQGLVSVTLKGVKHMRKDEGGVGGTIINVSSSLGLVKFPGLPIYSGSKMAVLHFSQCLAMDPFFANTGIRVLTICFGPTDTPLLHNLESKCYEQKLGEKFGADSDKVMLQTVESAVEAFVQMFRIGAPGSIWASSDNKPAQDITPLIDGAFKDFQNVMLA